MLPIVSSSFQAPHSPGAPKPPIHRFPSSKNFPFFYSTPCQSLSAVLSHSVSTNFGFSFLYALLPLPTPVFPSSTPDHPVVPHPVSRLPAFSCPPIHGISPIPTMPLRPSRLSCSSSA